MGDHAHIPFDAAAEPCVAHRQVARLKYWIDIQQFAPARFMHQRPQASAPIEQERGAQNVVFEDGDALFLRLTCARVVILHGVGQIIRHESGVTITLQRLILRRVEVGQRIVRAQRHGGNCPIFEA